MYNVEKKVHNKSPKEMEAFHDAQVMGGLKYIKANKDSSEEILDDEKHMYHVRFTEKFHDPSINDMVIRSKIVPYSISDYENKLMKTGKNLYTPLNFKYHKIEIVHDPTLKAKKVTDKSKAS